MTLSIKLSSQSFLFIAIIIILPLSVYTVIIIIFPSLMYFTVITLYFLCFYNPLRLNALYVLSSYKPLTWFPNAFCVKALCCILCGRFILFSIFYVASCLLLFPDTLACFHRQYANFAHSTLIGRLKGRLEGFRSLMPMLYDTISLQSTQ